MFHGIVRMLNHRLLLFAQNNISYFQAKKWALRYFLVSAHGYFQYDKRNYLSWSFCGTLDFVKK